MVRTYPCGTKSSDLSDRGNNRLSLWYDHSWAGRLGRSWPWPWALDSALACIKLDLELELEHDGH